MLNENLATSHLNIIPMMSRENLKNTFSPSKLSTKMSETLKNLNDENFAKFYLTNISY